jgi:hypothetical protein
VDLSLRIIFSEALLLLLLRRGRIGGTPHGAVWRRDDGSWAVGRFFFEKMETFR